MNVSVIKCKTCESIFVINNEDLWKFRTCTNCGSSNIVNLDEAFDSMEIIDEDKG